MRSASEFTVELDDDDVVHITLPRWEALTLSQLIRIAATEYATSRDARQRMRGIAAEIARKTRPEKVLTHNRRAVERPPSAFSSEIDIDHVLYGSAPFPVLSARDMRTAYRELEAMGKSAKQISQRLYVAQRTVNRWRRKLREEGEKT